jgi:ABC-type enterochelin transport system substrate-binding protein
MGEILSPLQQTGILGAIVIGLALVVIVLWKAQIRGLREQVTLTTKAAKAQADQLTIAYDDVVKRLRALEEDRVVQVRHHATEIVTLMNRCLDTLDALTVEIRTGRIPNFHAPTRRES